MNFDSSLINFPVLQYILCNDPSHENQPLRKGFMKLISSGKFQRLQYISWKTFDISVTMNMCDLFHSILVCECILVSYSSYKSDFVFEWCLDFENRFLRISLCGRVSCRHLVWLGRHCLYRSRYVASSAHGHVLLCTTNKIVLCFQKIEKWKRKRKNRFRRTEFIRSLSYWTWKELYSNWTFSRKVVLFWHVDLQEWHPAKFVLFIFN